MIKPFLILQLRPEDEAADNEFEAFLKAGGLEIHEVHRIRMEKESVPDINLADYSGVIIGGGPSNASDPEEKQTPEQKRFEPELYKLFDKMVEQDFPYLGACYGLGIFVRYLGGQVAMEKRYSEPVGAITVNPTDAAKDDPLTIDLPPNFRAFAGHKESCLAPPPGATLLADSAKCPVHMIRYKQNMYATQFHPELDQYGLALRINIYRHAGYFPPEDAEKHIEAAMQEEITVPELIFRRFVARYSQVATSI